MYGSWMYLLAIPKRLSFRVLEMDTLNDVRCLSSFWLDVGLQGAERRS